MKEKSEVAELQLFVLLGRRGGPRKGGGAPPALVLGISVGESPPPPPPCTGSPPAPATAVMVPFTELLNGAISGF